MTKRVKITDNDLKLAVQKSSSFYDVLRELGLKLSGGSHGHYKRRVESLGLDTSHFLGAAWKTGRSDGRRRSASDVLILRTSGKRQKTYLLKRSLLESGIECKCSKCGLGEEWNGVPLTLDIDHINENWLDDRLENLRFLCPNCHSQFSRKLIPGI